MIDATGELINIFTLCLQPRREQLKSSEQFPLSSHHIKVSRPGTAFTRLNHRFVLL